MHHITKINCKINIEFAHHVYGCVKSSIRQRINFKGRVSSPISCCYMRICEYKEGKRGRGCASQNLKVQFFVSGFAGGTKGSRARAFVSAAPAFLM